MLRIRYCPQETQRQLINVVLHEFTMNALQYRLATARMKITKPIVCIRRNSDVERRNV